MGSLGSPVGSLGGPVGSLGSPSFEKGMFSGGRGQRKTVALATPSSWGTGSWSSINWDVGVIFKQQCLRVRENPCGRMNHSSDGEGKGWAVLVSCLLPRHSNTPKCLTPNLPSSPSPTKCALGSGGMYLNI